MTDAGVTPQAKAAKTFGRGRYSPGAYTLDLSEAMDLPMTLNGEASTFGDVFAKLRDSKIREIPSISIRIDEYGTDDGKIVLSSDDWAPRSTMRMLAALMRDGINPSEVVWYYYDHDWSSDADESHTFFAVSEDKIILPACHFSSEEPLVLKREKGDDSVWHSHPYFTEASDIYWYRRFYTETITGQLMVLRPDEPRLYHFERPRVRDTTKDVAVVTLIKAYRLLWIAVSLLIAVAFPLTKTIMLVIATLMLLDLLWRCWETRNVGQDD